MLAGVVAAVAWGTLAFGAVYPWAYKPLATGCALAGVYGLYGARRRGWKEHSLLLALCFLIIVPILQLIPLPSATLKAFSPSADAFLRSQDLSYALEPRSHALSIDPRATILGLALLASFSLFLLGLVRALRNSSARRLVGSLIILGVVVALIGIVQKATLGDHAYMGMKIYGIWEPESKLTTPFGPFVNKNHFAGWMLMVLPLALALALEAAERGLGRAHDLRSALLWLSSRDGGRFQLLLFAAAIMAASMLMTGSRSGLGGLVFITIAAAFSAARRFESGRMRWMVLGSAAALFAVVFVWAGADVAARVGKGTSAVELRKRIWHDTTTIVRDFPMTGSGVNTFGTAMVVYQSSNRDVHYQEAHNDYLQIVAEGGIPLAVATIAFAVAAVRTIRRRIATDREEDITGYWVRVGAVIGILAIALQSFVEFSLQMPGNAALFVVLLALAMHRPGPRPARPHVA